MFGLQDAVGLLNAADLHILPQDRAAADLVFPSKLGPILASRKPVVVTADRGSDLGRWLGSAAILCPAGDGDALAATIAAAVAGRAFWDAGRAAELAASLDAAALLPVFAGLLMPAHEPRSAATEPDRAAPLAAAYMPAG